MDKKVLRKLQLEELDILNEIDKICKNNKIDYFIAYGTALGAVRHKGFIPWDDDIDICMTMKDYKKFETIILENLNPKFFFQSLKTERNLFVYWNKIRINNTLCAVKGEENLPLHLGIGIDVFPLAKYPQNKKLQKKFIKLMKLVFIILEANNKNKKHLSTAKSIFYKLLAIIPNSIRKKIVSSIIEKVLYYDGDYEYYAEYQEIYKKILLFPKDLIEKTKLIKFETEKFPIIKECDKYLTLIYGDYMKLPPKKARKSHGNLIIKFSDGKEYKNE